MVTTACRIVIRCLVLAVLVLFGWWPFVIHAANEPEGAIRGTVTDRDTGDPIGAVRVNVMEALRRGVSSAEGAFIIEGLKPGRYTVSFSRDGYVRAIVTDVIVQAGQLTDLRVELNQEIVDMEELIVTAGDLFGGTETGLLEIRQFSATVQDAISADLMKKAAASTAADALRLVVGTSVQEGKYVVIRGLSDRYTSTQMNGVRLPTADSDRRAVQVDQFPAAQIESITVTKSFTPDQQGEATGGSVNIRTRSIPDERFLSLSSAVEYNTQTTGKEMLTYRGGGTGYWGIDDGGRSIPFRASSIPLYKGASLNTDVARERLPNAVKLTNMTDALSPVMGTTTREADPNHSWSIAAGDRFNLGGEGNFGVLGGFSYRRKYNSYDDGVRNTYTYNYAGEVPNNSTEFSDKRGIEEVQWSASAGLGYELAQNHELALSFVYTQTTTDEARFLEDDALPNQVWQQQTLRYNERATSTIQLTGRHMFEELARIKLDWTAAYNTSSQYEPDQRFFSNYFDPDIDAYSRFDTPLLSTRRIWRDVSEDSRQAFFNLTVPFTQWTRTEGYFKFGPFYDLVERDLTQDSLVYDFAAQAGPGTPENLANQALARYYGPGHWTDVFLDRNRTGLALNNPPARNQLLWYAQATGADIDYTADQTIVAGYGMVELPLLSWLKLIGGVRAEQTDMSITIRSARGSIQVVETNEFGDFVLIEKPDEAAGASISQLDILPSAGVVWQIIPNLNLRANWGRTIARPTFRELAPVRTFEFLGADQFVGNPDLNISRIENYDLRIEWFRRPGDVLAFSIFYKDLQDPIELILLNIAGNRMVRPANYPSGTIVGIEIEARQKLDIIHPLFADFSIGGNATLMDSEVVIPPSERGKLVNAGIVSSSRAMFGQPEHLFNINLVYDNRKSGTTVGLFYNLIGKRLIIGEAFSESYSPNVFEQPTDRLDLTIEQKIGKNWSIAFRAKNLTDPLIETAYEVDWVSDPITRTAYRRGREFSLGATCKW